MDAGTSVDISIVIVNFHSEDYVARCLASLPAGGRLERVEVIVVDNSPGALRALVGPGRGRVLIENAENVGFGRACNQGFAQARGRALLLLNPDTEVRPGALTALLAYLDAHPAAGAVAARLLNSDGSLQPSCRPLPALWSAMLDCVGISTFFPRPPLFGRYRVGIWDADRVREVAQPMGACLCIRREALADVGPLDERFFVYFEDVDWCLRARRRGWRIGYNPRSEMIHHEGRSAARDPRGASRAYYRSKLAFYRKHFAGVRRTVLEAMLLAEIGIRWLASTVRGGPPGSSAPPPARAAAYKAAWHAVLSDLRAGGH